MDINNILDKCHKILYEGFTTNHIGENSWLNDVCGNLNDLFNYIHQFLKCKPIKDSNIFDLCFLCISQILCGIKNLHKAIQVEILEEVHLMLIRQHFLDSILWCLARLKSTILSIDDDVNPILITKMNFVNDMDTILELIAPFAIYDTVASEKYNNTNANNIIDHENNEILTTSKNIRAIINSLLAHSLAFTNIALEDDNKALKATCRKVLKECIAFEEECSTTQFKHYEQDFCLRAAILENSLYQLDKLVNDCLLRLVITVFGDLDNLPLTKLRRLYEENCKQDELDKEIEKFDIIIDRLLQIGIFAIAFCDDQKLKSTLRSCLASIELLDTDLIPSIFSQSKYDSQILEKHWNEEIQLLRESIQFIIDTKGFCTTMIDILTIGIDKLDKQFNKIFIEQLLTQCNVLYENILLNYKLLNLHEKSSPIAVHFIDFQLMLNECKIAIQFDSVTEKRIMKRMKILLIKLKKCTALMPTTTIITTAATPTTNASATLIDTNANDNINIKVDENSISNDNNINNNNNNNEQNIINDDKIIIHDNEISINNNNNNNNNYNNYNSNENIININKTPNEILIDSENFFESFGIQPSLQSILYTSATIKSITSCNNSTNNNNNSFMKDLKSLNLFQSIEKPNRKRGSLRLQMFKKHNDAQEIFPMEINNKSEIESDSDFLHITNILEQLTDLSTTFSK